MLEIIVVLPRYLLVTMAILGGIHSAHAHGIAGNRFFPGTLSFDDPAVADEAIVPNFAGFNLNPPAGSREAKSIRSCLKSWRPIKLTLTSPRRARPLNSPNPLGGIPSL